MRPIIVMTTENSLSPFNGQPVYNLNLSYCQAVSAAGGLPLLATSAALAEEYAEMADGLLVTGGSSVHPCRYHETFESLAQGGDVNILIKGCNPTRDEIDFSMFKAFMKRKKPILGICRGHQMLTAATGGKLMLNFPGKHGTEHQGGITHGVNVLPDSMLGKLFGEHFQTNSFHRDAACVVGEEMRATAYSEDGIIEAIEHKTLPVFGVQFHPERMRGESIGGRIGPDMSALFEYFMSLCK